MCTFVNESWKNGQISVFLQLINGQILNYDT